MTGWATRKLDPVSAKLIDLAGEVAPEPWARAVSAQWQRIEEVQAIIDRSWSADGSFGEQIEAAGRLRYESHFLVVAIRNVLRVQEVYFELTEDQRLAEARRTFDAAVTDAKDVRDMLEHIDDYQLNRGKLQRTGLVQSGPSLQLAIHKGKGAPVKLQFDRYELDLGEATRAALELAAATADVWSDRVARGMHEWADSEPAAK